MNNTEIIKKSLMKRHLAESRFKTYGILGIISATVFLIVILSTIFIEGKSAFKSRHLFLRGGGFPQGGPGEIKFLIFFNF